MPKLRVHNFAMSLDGYAAGPRQSLENPLGEGAERLHEWIFETRFWHTMTGEDGGTEGIDNAWLERGDAGIGATVMGRNMFGPVRGDWSSWQGDQWRGWWGEEPPYHHPVFVLTHYPQPPIEMAGGTTFHFTDAPIEDVLAMAFDAAGGKDVRLGGGAATVREYLRAGLVDEMHVPVVPVLLGSGERVFDGLENLPAGYECVEFAASPAVAHMRLARIAA